VKIPANIYHCLRRRLLGRG